MILPGRARRLNRPVRRWSPTCALFELAKLRMLNGAHSTIAYMGLAAGYVTVDQAIADPAIAAVIDRLMRVEAASTLPPVPGLDKTLYADALLKRFANAALEHRLAQIAMDGSQKLPQRLLGTIADVHVSRRRSDGAAARGVSGMDPASVGAARKRSAG